MLIISNYQTIIISVSLTNILVFFLCSLCRKQHNKRSKKKKFYLRTRETFVQLPCLVLTIDFAGIGRAMVPIILLRSRKETFRPQPDSIFSSRGPHLRAERSQDRTNFEIFRNSHVVRFNELPFSPALFTSPTTPVLTFYSGAEHRERKKKDRGRCDVR